MESKAAEDGEFLLPVGTVTLLLADTEGSVGLWESRGDAMSQILTRFESLVNDIIGSHGGVRPAEQGEGDSFVVAFARPSDAASCALALQLALTSEDPGEMPIRLRMALHTGEVQLKDERNYIGQTINRCSRLRDIGYGGQTLLSQATYELVVDRLPVDTDLEDQGVHRLRDLARPEHVYQLVHPKLPHDFAPLRSLDALPNNLPVQLTSFVGRSADIAEVRRLLVETRVVTLTGSGGCGKTRLALQVAAEILDDFSDGVWLVDLAPARDPALVKKFVASAIGIQEEPGVDLQDSLIRRLARQSALILFDNCEHLVSACAELADALVRKCPGVGILATSREPLGVEGEIAWRVPSLTVPDEGQPPRIEALAQYEAVQLFIDRAVKARPNFQVNNENAAALAQICQRLEGIPLAIELAAARVRMLTPGQIAEGLIDRFHLLTGGNRMAMPRQQTLQASVDWSHELLSERERVLLRRLSVFSGGFTLDAAEGVCSSSEVEQHQVLDLLGQLVDKSLVVAEEKGTVARYGLLETIRQYAQDRLEESGEEAEVKTRHRDFYRSFAVETRKQSLGKEQDAWFAQLGAEHDNLRAALSWSKEQEDFESLLWLAASLVYFWGLRGYHGEARTWYETALSGPKDMRRDLRALVLTGLGYAEIGSANGFVVPPLAHEALAIYRETEDKLGIAHSLHQLGWVATGVDAAQARAYFEEGLREAREEAAAAREKKDSAREKRSTWAVAGILEGLSFSLGSRGESEAVGIADEAIAIGQAAGAEETVRRALVWRGGSLLGQGRIAEAIDQLEQGVASAREVGNNFTLVAALGLLGPALVAGGDYARSLEVFEEARLVNPLAGDGRGLAVFARGDPSRRRELLAAHLEKPSWVPRSWVLVMLGSAQLAEGDLEGADETLNQSERECRKGGDKRNLAMTLTQLARLARLRGEYEKAEDLCHEALLIHQERGDKAWASECLEVLAAIATTLESPLESARLFGAAQTMRDTNRLVRTRPEQQGYEADLAATRDALSEADLRAAWEAGAALSYEEALAYARRGRGERKRPSVGWASLTPQELQVAKLIGEGLKNAQIAERMFISRHTVESYLKHIFRKLGLSSRTELALKASRRET